jgi:hypothetical protein
MAGDKRCSFPVREIDELVQDLTLRLELETERLP